MSHVLAPPACGFSDRGERGRQTGQGQEDGEEAGLHWLLLPIEGHRYERREAESGRRSGGGRSMCHARDIRERSSLLSDRSAAPPKTTIRRVAIEFPVQRLQIGDVVALPEQGSEVEATVVREIDRTELTVRVTLRVEGREDFIKEWPIGEMVTVVRGP